MTIDREKIREFRGITKTANHNLDNGGLKAQEIYFRDLAKAEQNVLKKKLYEEMAEVCVLKADEIRLRRNERPESTTVQSMIEEEAQTNDLTRFERFKKWAKKKHRRYLCSCYTGCGYYNHHRYGCTDRDQKRGTSNK